MTERVSGGVMAVEPGVEVLSERGGGFENFVMVGMPAGVDGVKCEIDGGVAVVVSGDGSRAVSWKVRLQTDSREAAQKALDLGKERGEVRCRADGGIFEVRLVTDAMKTILPADSGIRVGNVSGDGVAVGHGSVARKGQIVRGAGESVVVEEARVYLGAREREIVVNASGDVVLKGVGGRVVSIVSAGSITAENMELEIGDSVVLEVRGGGIVNLSSGKPLVVECQVGAEGLVVATGARLVSHEVKEGAKRAVYVLGQGEEAQLPRVSVVALGGGVMLRGA